MLCLCPGGTSPQLLVLNTLLPQQDPRTWRILHLPPLPNHDKYYSVLTQYEKPVAECPGFSMDPTQRIFVVLSLRKQTFAVPVEPLMQRMYSVHANACIRWEEWGEDVITVHLHPDTQTLQLFDTRLLALCGSAHYPEHWGVRMYDLSKSGRGDIQIQRTNEGAGRRYRRDLSTPKWFARCKIGDGIPYNTQLVGNKVVCFFVSPLYARKCSCHTKCYYRVNHGSVTARAIYASGRWVEGELK